jgi:hypothetical protein
VGGQPSTPRRHYGAGALCFVDCAQARDIAREYGDRANLLARTVVGA